MKEVCDYCGREIDLDQESDVSDCSESLCPYAVFNYDALSELDFDKELVTVYNPEPDLYQDIFDDVYSIDDLEDVQDD